MSACAAGSWALRKVRMSKSRLSLTQGSISGKMKPAFGWLIWKRVTPGLLSISLRRPHLTRRDSRPARWSDSQGPGPGHLVLMDVMDGVGGSCPVYIRLSFEFLLPAGAVDPPLRSSPCFGWFDRKLLSLHRSVLYAALPLIFWQAVNTNMCNYSTASTREPSVSQTTEAPLKKGSLLWKY